MTFPLESLYNWYREIIANPKYRWWVVGATLLYVLSPIDIIPDVFPIVGQIDDAVVITLLATEIASLLKDRNLAMKQKREAKVSETNAAEANAAEANAHESVDVESVEVNS